MYVVTFYSFKGGVGRTMALVNIGVELARSGRRVLLVDFDLEAPGIETFNLPRPRESTPGVIDYVLRYVDTNEAPDVGEFIYECPQVGDDGGQLWIMPSGLDDRSYERKLHSIDWQDLYANRNGYLLIEDLKAQWNSFLAPDYVLVDSRTGFTDESGICTRQLPDSVVVMFFPTEQNLRGLKKVVADIVAEPVRSGRSDIRLHFVTSNVPDLDDDNRTLANRLARFSEGLGYHEISATIHHNESLALLNQVVFTRDHPQSRLTHEYRALTRVVRSKNLADRDAALEDLQNLLRRPLKQPLSDDYLQTLAELHAGDVEVLDQLASVERKQGRISNAIKLLSDAVQVAGENPHLLRRRAQLYWLTGDSAAAEADVMEALKNAEVSIEDLAPLATLLRQLGPNNLARLPVSRAVQGASAEARSVIANQLMNTRDELRVALALLEPVQTTESAFIPAALCLIGLRKFAEARLVLESLSPVDQRIEISRAFNRAIAMWGETGAVPVEMMQRVLELDLAHRPRNPRPNYFQCLAVASYSVGDPAAASNFVRHAQERIMASPAPDFSCWQYLNVPALKLYEDLNVMSRLLEDTEALVPAFMRDRLAVETGK